MLNISKILFCIWIHFTIAQAISKYKNIIAFQCDNVTVSTGIPSVQCEFIPSNIHKNLDVIYYEYDDILVINNITLETAGAYICFSNFSSDKIHIELIAVTPFPNAINATNNTICTSLSYNGVIPSISIKKIDIFICNVKKLESFTWFTGNITENTINMCTSYNVNLFNAAFQFEITYNNSFPLRSNIYVFDGISHLVANSSYDTVLDNCTVIPNTIGSIYVIIIVFGILIVIALGILIFNEVRVCSAYGAV